MSDILKIFVLGMMLAGFSNLFWGIFVYLKNPKELQNKVFLFVGISFAIWTFSYALWLAQTNYNSALFWSRMLNLGAILIPIFFLHWVIVFLELKKKKTIIFGYVLTAFFAVFSFSPWFIKSVRPVSISQYWPQANWLYTVFLISCFLGLFGYGFVLLLNSKRQIVDKEKNIQWQYIFWGALISCIGGSFNFPLMYGINFFPILTLLTIFHPFLWSQGILKHGLFKTKTVATEFFIGLLIIILFINIFFYTNFFELIFKIIVFMAATMVSVLLIKSVIKEVQQREKLEILTKELGTANDKLKELDKLKSQFLSFASHQVKAPMNVVKGYATLIYDGTYGPASEKIKDTAIKIKDSADRMIALVNNIMDLRKIEEGKMEFKFEEANIGDMVADVAGEFRMLAENKGLRLDFSKPEKIFMANVDIQKMRQSIQNLVENAIKYTDTGWVKVEVGEFESNQILITVSDSGHGISPELLPHLFNQYQRDSATASKIEGTGLGLYIAKQIITGNHGDIWAESEGEGKGSKFHIKIPSSIAQ